MLEINRITSRENRRLILARKVRDGKEGGLIFIEGRRLSVEALRSDISIEECFISEDFGDDELVTSILEKGIGVAELPSSIFVSIAATENPQGIILLAERPVLPIENFWTDEAALPLFLFLKEINNPSNLGAILRTVEAAGAGGVFISTNSADVFSPKALRASMGAAFRVRIMENADLESLIGQAKSGGIGCLALDASAAADYLDVDWQEPHLLVFGSEAHGLSETELELIGGSIAIPMKNSVESLNLSVAAAIVLFEAKRQGSLNLV